MTSPSLPVEIKPVLPADYPAIRRFAEQIWPEVYADIITPPQVSYMIERMYAREVIEQEVQSGGIHYCWIVLGEDRIGFFAFGPLIREAICHLHKLYVLPSHHGHGYGSAALNWILERVSREGAQQLELRVNRNNTAAIRCYEKNGFRKLGEDCLDIGNGFVMDDFLMGHPLHGDKVDFSIAQDH